MTVGHSTHDIEAFLDLLSSQRIELVVDVRRFPASRRHPQFNAEALEESLTGVGIGLLHLPGLGGRRKPKPGSVNSGWELEAFQGYADHMETPEFQAALKVCMDEASARRAVAMCAEAPWWKCHRRILSDALSARGWKVRHIMPAGEPREHRFPEFAILDGERVTYPPVQRALPLDPWSGKRFRSQR